MLAPNQRFSEEITAVIYQHLAEFVAANPVVSLAVLTSGDGFEIAAHPPKNEITQRIAAMSSSLQALADAIVREAGLNKSRNLVIEATEGTVVVMGVSNVQPRLSLAVIATGNEMLGHVLWATRNCCASLERSLQV
jgi:uncharacterized protein